MTDQEKRELEQKRAAEEKAAAEQKAREEAAAKQARETEKARQTEIRSICTKLGIGEDFAKRMIDEDKSLDQVRALVIEEKAKQTDESTQIRNANPVITAGETDGEKWQRGASHWLVQRSGAAVSDAVEKAQGGKEA
jgi:hypothetical protein